MGLWLAMHMCVCVGLVSVMPPVILDQWQGWIHLCQNNGQSTSHLW